MDKERIKEIFSDEEFVTEEVFDIAVTSPPYFNTEHYSVDDTDSAIRYPEYNLWVNNFYTPLIVNTINRLSDNEKKMISFESDYTTGAHPKVLQRLIENGYVYSAVPPLYKLKRGKTERVAYSDEQRDQVSAEMRGESNAKIDISRFKGLGEMDPHELWETTMDPEKRTLRRITLADAQRADEIFTILMGEQVEPRKEWIETNAKYAINIDI